MRCRLPPLASSCNSSVATNAACRGWTCVRFVKLVRIIRRRRAGVLAVIGVGLSNARRGGLNSRIRRIGHHSIGFTPSAARLPRLLGDHRAELHPQGYRSYAVAIAAGGHCGSARLSGGFVARFPGPPVNPAAGTSPGGGPWRGSRASSHGASAIRRARRRGGWRLPITRRIPAARRAHNGGSRCVRRCRGGKLVNATADPLIATGRSLNAACACSAARQTRDLES
jgi:hypothetical protein